MAAVGEHHLYLERAIFHRGRHVRDEQTSHDPCVAERSAISTMQGSLQV